MSKRKNKRKNTTSQENGEKKQKVEMEVESTSKASEVKKPKFALTKFKRSQLPIDLVEWQLMSELVQNDTLVVIGETGSGKSTQLPQMCVRLGMASNGAIGVTQPRRVAAVSLATRVSAEMGSRLGQEVGYHVRFENVTTKKTKIEYMTDGIVLRKALASPLLKDYSVMIIDEAHERSLHTDVLMCVLKECQEKRKNTEKPLKLIIMSATLQAQKFSDYFNNAKIVVVSGRTYPIEMFYASKGQDGKAISSSDYVYNAMVTVKDVHLNEPSGHDILIFLTGSEEIEVVANRLLELNKSIPREKDVILPVPLYAALRPEQQREAFKKAPQGSRKVILSTNIAETSVTIPGIRVVIDCGKVKTKSFNALDRVEVLRVHDVSRAQATQRAGRAGRDAPGKCYRLYTKKMFNEFEAENVPEILRSNLAASFLELLKMGMDNPHNLQLIDQPEKENVDAALKELKSLGAIASKDDDATFELTELGLRFCAFPLPPDHARVLLMAQKEGCTHEALRIIAAMQAESIFYGSNGVDERSEEEIRRARRRFETNEGDHVMVLKVMLAADVFFKGEEVSNAKVKKFCEENMLNERHLKTVVNIVKQLTDICVEKKIKTEATCGANFDKLRKSLAEGLFMNSCEYDRQEDRYRLLVNPAITLRIHPSSCLARSKPSCIVFTELMKTNDLYAMQVSLIDKEWVQPLVTAYKKMH